MNHGGSATASNDNIGVDFLLDNLWLALIYIERIDMQKINLAEAFGRFHDHWSPKVAGELNDSMVKLAKFSGKFHWHHHEDEDELFLVVSGRLRMGLRTGDIDLEPGEFIIVPKGTEHCPEALTDECNVILLEPKSTLNTGNVVNERTVRDLDRL